LNLNNVKLEMSAGNKNQLIKNQKPQIAFSGRSNVGKSSLLNRLMNRKKLARVSGEPGKTITVNFFNVDEEFYFVDLPGYGYAKRSESEIKRWSDMTQSYFEDNDSLKLIIQLIDLKVMPTKDDIMMLEWLDYNKKPFIVVATKSDKLNKTNYEKNLKELAENEYLKDVPILPFSALSGKGENEIWSEIKKSLDL